MCSRVDTRQRRVVPSRLYEDLVRLMTMPPTVWHETYDVRTYEVNPNGRASIQTIGNYLQDIAGKHAAALGVSNLDNPELAWVLSYMCIQMDCYPRFGETVHLETWPSGIASVYAIRDFLLKNQENKRLGAATSTWIVLDLNRRRPVRMPASVTRIPLPDRPAAIEHAARKLQAPTDIAFSSSFAVRYSDLDLNGHVNNVRYMEWAVESVPHTETEGRRLHQLELQFKAETHYGETIGVATGHATHADTTIFAHRLTRTSDTQEVALVRSQWQAHS